MNPKHLRLVALVASIGFTACGDSSEILLGELSEAEAEDLAGVVLAATFASTASVPQPALATNGPQAVPFAFASEIDGPVDCALGGSVNVAASFEVTGDTDSDAGSIEYSMTQIHDACIVSSENDVMFTLWGNPSMNAAFTVENDGQGLVEWAGSIQGIVDWETDGREGSCSVAIEFTGRTATGASAAAELLGTVCGFNINHSASIG